MHEKEESYSALIKRLKELTEDSSKLGELSDFLHSLHAADIAEALDDLTDDECTAVLSLLNNEEVAEVIDEASDNQKEEIFDDITDQRLADIVEYMPPDEAAEALELVDDSRARSVLQKIDEEQAEDIRELREYDPETAGRIMTTEYLAVPRSMTVEKVLEEVRSRHEDIETTHHILVIDDKERLIGHVMIDDLIKNDGTVKVAELMDRAVICIHAERDQEVAARMMEKYDLGVLPVVGDGGKLLGIITFDDILEVMEEEASEDMFRIAGIGADDPFNEGVFKRAYKRLPWLTTTLVGGALLAVIISNFQPTLRQIVALVSFIPVIAGLGGNVGIQSSTIMVRGLATGDIDGLGDIFWLLKREIAVGSIIGIAAGSALAILANIFLSIISPEHIASGGIHNLLWFCMILGVSVLCGILAAATIGTVAPLLCHKIGVDPAVAAGPFVTVSIDIITQTIYLSIATALLL